MRPKNFFCKYFNVNKLFVIRNTEHWIEQKTRKCAIIKNSIWVYRYTLPDQCFAKVWNMDMYAFAKTSLQSSGSDSYASEYQLAKTLRFFTREKSVKWDTTGFI